MAKKPPRKSILDIAKENAATRKKEDRTLWLRMVKRADPELHGEVLKRINEWLFVQTSEIRNLCPLKQDIWEVIRKSVKDCVPSLPQATFYDLLTKLEREHNE
jgi:hypothetical protein